MLFTFAIYYMTKKRAKGAQPFLEEAYSFYVVIIQSGTVRFKR